MIRLDGYYMSERFHWVDWHAGHKFEGDKYYLMKFLSKNNVLRASSKKKEIDDNIFENRMDHIDYYIIIDDNTLEITINPNSEWKVIRKFTILSPEILLDENLKEYRFVPNRFDL